MITEQTTTTATLLSQTSAHAGVAVSCIVASRKPSAMRVCLLIVQGNLGRMQTLVYQRLDIETIALFATNLVPHTFTYESGMRAGAAT